MTELKTLLETTQDGQSLYLVLNDGMEIELMNFEQVDESIYDKSDIMTADVVEKIVGDSRFHTPGSIFEFSLLDVEKVKFAKDGDVLHHSKENKRDGGNYT